MSKREIEERGSRGWTQPHYREKRRGNSPPDCRLIMRAMDWTKVVMTVVG